MNLKTEAKTFKTTNIDLERFLFGHGVRFYQQGRTEDGLAYWIYNRTPKFEQHFSQYKRIYPWRFKTEPRKEENT